METKILLFDFDGTIADSAESAVSIYNAIAKENNFRLITKEDLATLRNRSAMDNVRHFGVPIYKMPMIVKRVREKMKKEVPNLKAFKGIADPLRSLKNKGYKLYIVSTNSKENIQDFLKRNQIQEFDDIYSVFNLFGKHVKINRLIKENNWDRSSVMYIGDEVRDIEAAKKSGVTSVAVSWGFNTEEALRKNNPDKLLINPTELSLL